MAEPRGPHPLSLFLALLQRQLSDRPDRLSRAIAGLNRYQNAPPLPAQQAFPEVARIGHVRLLAAGGPADAPPLVVVPSIINAPIILDIAPERSLLRHLTDAGHRVLLVDWGRMERGERRLGLSGLISMRLVPLLERLDGPVSLVGYCLGGTMAIAAGQLLEAKLARLALIATPWHFSGYSDVARADATRAWREIEPLGRLLGAVPISVLNPLFWSLDEAGVVAKFEALAARAADDPGLAWFAAIKDWAGSGAPLPMPAARDLFLLGFTTDRIGAGRWKVSGQQISPDNLTAPILDISATRDRIVPPAARIRTPHAQYLDVRAGHVGMLIGAKAEETLWRPLSNWLHGR